MCALKLLNEFYGICCSFFINLDVFLRPLVVPLPRYGHKLVFAGFEIGFTALAVLFLALRRYFCVDHRYLCEDTRKTSVSWLLNWFYGICHSIFSTFNVLFCQSEVLLPKYE